MLQQFNFHLILVNGSAMRAFAYLCNIAKK